MKKNWLTIEKIGDDVVLTKCSREAEGEITIPEFVTRINKRAFTLCLNITSINIPASVTNIEDGIHFGDLTSINVEKKNKIYDSRNNCNAIIESATNTLIAGCTSTIIPASVTGIGNYAFCHCSGLTSVNIPEGVTRIGDYAFMDCTDLTSIHLPSSLTDIGKGAFFGCKGLTTINIPSGVSTIGEYAFCLCCGLTSIYIPESIISLGHSVFSNCDGLTTIQVESGNAVYDSRNNCNAIIESATNTLIAGCASTIIPASVTGIGNYAFCGCSGLTSVNIPDGVTCIGDSAFFDCNCLTSIKIPESVTTIGPKSFHSCWDLKKIIIPKSVSKIGKLSFADCVGLKTIQVESGNAVYDSRRNCNAIIESATNKLIVGCFNTSIPDSVISIGDGAFRDCNGLRIITIPESVKSIGNGAFRGCVSLKKITIPQNITNIDKIGLSDCYKLSKIIISKKEPLEITTTTFKNRSKLTLYVPSGSKKAYKKANIWNEFKEIVEY